ncbi:hypothetical protein P7C70_g156, partial [Phenoliferia sp. Uapishka_3]
MIVTFPATSPKENVTPLGDPSPMPPPHPIIIDVSYPKTLSPPRQYRLSPIDKASPVACAWWNSFLPQAGALLLKKDRLDTARSLGLFQLKSWELEGGVIEAVNTPAIMLAHSNLECCQAEIAKLAEELLPPPLILLVTSTDVPRSMIAYGTRSTRNIPWKNCRPSGASKK